jgi:hypothetical protein
MKVRMANPVKVRDLLKAAVGEAAFDEIRARQALKAIRDLLQHPSNPGGLTGLFAAIERQITVGLGEEAVR